MAFELRQSFRIESARYLPELPPEHPCSRMHGHSFHIVLRLVGELHPTTQWLMDYNEIQVIAAPVLQQLDHRVLNDVEGLRNPTTENLCRWLFEKLQPKLSALIQVIIKETQDSECRYPAASDLLPSRLPWSAPSNDSKTSSQTT